MPARSPVLKKNYRPDRDLVPLAARQYDLVIIGGGITGATILWDATLRGMKALLLEKNDYASGTTQATSKLIHGGLRYLKNLEFGLVRESLRERRTLARIAPHAVRPETFLMPIYKHFGHGRAKMALALWLYDALGFDRNRGLPADARLPAHYYLDRDAALVEEPVLREAGLSGAYVYFDFANLNPERLCCEFIFSARERGAAARNYVEVAGVKRTPEGYTVDGRDGISGQTARFRARAVVNASGPWADFLEDRLASDAPVKAGPGSRRLLRSKGIHIITRKIARDKSLALTLPGPDKQHFFVLPWRGKSIIGTTDTVYQDHPDALSVSRAEIQSLLENVNTVTRANLTLKDVDYYYAGLRPLVETQGNGNGSGDDTYNASRKTEVHHHNDRGYPGFFTALGGKYTTSRYLAERIVDELAEYLPGTFAACTTASEPLGGGDFTSRPKLEAKLMERFPETPYLRIQTLSARYGEKAEEILRATESGGQRWQTPSGEEFFEEEIKYLAANDEIQNLSDLYLRRAGLGTTGLPAETVNRQIAECVGKGLGWNRSDVAREIKNLEERFRIR